MANKVFIKIRIKAWVINKKIPLLINNFILMPTGININYIIKIIIFNSIPRIKLPFSVFKNKGNYIVRRVILRDEITLALGKIKFIRIKEKSLLIKYTFLF